MASEPIPGKCAGSDLFSSKTWNTCTPVVTPVAAWDEQQAGMVCVRTFSLAAATSRQCDSTGTGMLGGATSADWHGMGESGFRIEAHTRLAAGETISLARGRCETGWLPNGRAPS